jgi:hypothetical protein
MFIGVVFCAVPSAPSCIQPAMRAAASACAIVASLLAAAACGGGGSGKPATLHEWVSKANAICVDTQKKLDALGPAPPAIDLLSGYLDKAIPVLRSKVDQVKKLGLAPGQEARARLAIKVDQRIVDLDEQIRRASVADDGPQATRLTSEVQRQTSESGHLYSLIGATRCFSESS